MLGNFIEVHVIGKDKIAHKDPALIDAFTIEAVYPINNGANCVIYTSIPNKEVIYISEDVYAFKKLLKAANS